MVKSRGQNRRRIFGCCKPPRRMRMNGGGRARHGKGGGPRTFVSRYPDSNAVNMQILSSPIYSRILLFLLKYPSPISSSLEMFARLNDSNAPFPICGSPIRFFVFPIDIGRVIFGKVLFYKFILLLFQFFNFFDYESKLNLFFGNVIFSIYMSLISYVKCRMNKRITRV